MFPTRQRPPQSFNSTWGHPIAGMRLRIKNEFPTVQVMHLDEVRPRKDRRGFDLISEALPFGRLRRNFFGSFSSEGFVLQFTYCVPFRCGRANTATRCIYGNSALTNQSECFQKFGLLFFDPILYLSFEFHPRLNFANSAAFTNALNFSGFSCLTVRLLFDLRVVAGCLG